MDLRSEFAGLKPGLFDGTKRVVGRSGGSPKRDA